jgi:LmbE family N-acetylglucosaminyl deacetylase
MSENLRLLCVFAHPDDESLGAGSTLAKYAAEGVDTYLVTATRGERGWFGAEETDPGPEALGRTRTAELLAAADVLRLCAVDFLDYLDGDLDKVDPAEAVAKIVYHLRRVRPHVVITFGPDGAYGHPDHIAISQFTAAAVVCAADPQYGDGHGLPAHRVLKLYYMVESKEEVAELEAVLGEFGMAVDGDHRRAPGWDEWAITTRIDAREHWHTTWQAIVCHQTQLAPYSPLISLPEERQREMFGCRSYYRAMSLVNGGRAREHDLFAGIR